MAYFSRKGQLLEIGNMKYLASGECASVRYSNEIIFKEYFSDTIINCRLSEKLFDVLKDINDKHFIKLFEIYSDMSLSELIQYNIGLRAFIVDAYTAKYYGDDSINVLYESIDYLLDNFSELEKLFDIFSDNSIVADDVKRENAILSHNGIIIIDPDKFYKASFSKQDIAFENKNKLLALFMSICISCLEKEENKDQFITKIFLDLVNISIDNKTDITYEISKKLKHVKKPIDYLRK